VFKEWPEAAYEFLARRHVFLRSHPQARPFVRATAVTPNVRGWRSGGAILNHCHHFPGFVYHQACFSSDHRSIEIAVRPRKGSAAVCSRCHHPAPGYDQLPDRRYESIPFWGFLVFLLYSMRRVSCPRCQAVLVEQVPWGNGKHQLTHAYMLFLARWARWLSWKETAQAFRTSWDKVFDAVEYVVTYGLRHRTFGPIDAIGVDEIQYAKGHKYLTLVYQIDLHVTRSLWVGKEERNAVSTNRHHRHSKFRVDAIRTVSVPNAASWREACAKGCKGTNTTAKHTAAFAAIRLWQLGTHPRRFRHFACRCEAGVSQSWRGERSRAERLSAKGGCAADGDGARSSARERALARRKERAFAGS
jgi:hypothetical protein